MQQVWEEGMLIFILPFAFSSFFSFLSSIRSSAYLWKVTQNDTWVIALDKMFLVFFFNPKVLIFILFLHENIRYVYSLEVPQ